MEKTCCFISLLEKKKNPSTSERCFMYCEIGRKVEMFKESDNRFYYQSEADFQSCRNSRFKTFRIDHVALVTRTSVTFAARSQGCCVLSVSANSKLGLGGKMSNSSGLGSNFSKGSCIQQFLLVHSGRYPRKRFAPGIYIALGVPCTVPGFP